MPRLPHLSGREIVHVLERLGFKAVRQNGSYVVIWNTRWSVETGQRFIHQGKPASRQPLCCTYCPMAMPQTELLRFLAHVQADASLKLRLVEALSADEVSLLAQELGFQVSGSDILRFHGQSASGIRITRIDHPGEYPGRYY